jgi:hypothetical protein
MVSLIALYGQVGTHSPQALHLLSMISGGEYSSGSSFFTPLCEHTMKHSPQWVHLAWSMLTLAGLIAFRLHERTHLPQRVHFSVFILAFLPFMVIAFSGQAGIHSPHPLQLLITEYFSFSKLMQLPSFLQAVMQSPHPTQLVVRTE